jgi:hypothetical protein
VWSRSRFGEELKRRRSESGVRCVEGKYFVLQSMTSSPYRLIIVGHFRYDFLRYDSHFLYLT